MTRLLRIHVASTAIAKAKAKAKADGSAARPFASLEAARDALRKLRRRGVIKSPVRVLIAPGVYRLTAPLVFTPEDGGSERHPVTWSGDGGRALLSGARAITGWSEGTINGRPCWTAQLPEVAAGRWWFTQLFVNGRRRPPARPPAQTRLQPLRRRPRRGGQARSGRLLPWRHVLALRPRRDPPVPQSSSIPLALLALDPTAGSWAIDVVVNATAPGAQALSRVYLASETNPFGDTTSYVLATAAP